MKIIGKNDQKMCFFGIKHGKKECFNIKQGREGLKIVKLHLQPQQKMIRSSSMGPLGFTPSKITKKQVNQVYYHKKGSNQQKLLQDKNKILFQRDKSILQKLDPDFIAMKTIQKQNQSNTTVSEEVNANGDGQKMYSDNRTIGIAGIIDHQQKIKIVKNRIIQHHDNLNHFRDRRHSYLKLTTPLYSKKQYQKLHIFSQFSLSIHDGDAQWCSDLYFGKYKGSNYPKMIQYGQQCDSSEETRENIQLEEQKCKQLSEKIEEKALLIIKKDQELLNLQKNLQNAKTLFHIYQGKIDALRQSMALIQQEKQKIASFLHTQPNKILRSEVEGYKKCEQQLFDLAYCLEMSTYQKMLQRMYEEIEVPEGSFYYIIDSFQSALNCDQHAFKSMIDKLKTIYQNIKSHVISILQIKANKIQTFVSTLRELASFTIGKREYIEGLNQKLGILFGKYLSEFSYFANAVCSNSKEGLQKHLDILRQLFKEITINFSQSQIFY